MKDGKPAVTQPGIRVHGASPGHSIYFTFRSPDATDEDGYEDNFADGEVPFLQVCIDTRIPAPEIDPTSHCEIARSLVLDILAMAQRVGWHPDRITIDSVLFRHSDMWRSTFSPIAWSRNRSKLALSSPYTQQAQHRSAPDLALSCRRLSVGGDAVRGLLTTLKSKTTLSNVNGEPKADLLFPTLPRLDIQGVDFVENDGKLFELLRGTLVRRSLDVLLVNASPLVQVFVRRCNVTKEQIEKARKASPHIQKLWWDGRKKGLKKSGAEV
ncbi:hypothetical protein OF83DRAFT_1173155 [Amylostereum chailletii]|nr:hypothetical protein OF83DRAFT_1173155 [Amylostereum chailletii]